MKTLHPGEIYDAIVKRLEPYGAWIDCDGQTGLVNIPDISWSRTRHPSDVLSIGQRVQVKILATTPEHFAASIKAVHPEQDPWFDPTPFAVGTLHERPITMVLDYGCFMELVPNVEALLKIRRHEHTYSVGEVLRVRVINASPESRQVEVELA